MRCRQGRGSRLRRSALRQQHAPQLRLRRLPDSLRAAADPAMAQRRPDAALRGTGALDSL